MHPSKPAAILLIAVFAGKPALADTIVGRVVGVTDGDTITVLTADRVQFKVRLNEIDTPESRQPWGSRAKEALGDKVFGKTVDVQVSGTDRYGRTLGRVLVEGRDVNREMVREGHAWVYRQYMTDSSLLEDEAYARERGLGLWSLPEAEKVPPWEWRRGGQVAASPVQREAPATSATAGQAFTCSGKRYCREMSSCAEAQFYLNKCGLTRLDGDSDGVPCEAICR
jgi:endonuclease YncB( thermonuclease family)